MLTAQPLTITVPRPFLQRLKREASRRQATVSGLLRESFEYFTRERPRLYSDNELAALLRRDQLNSKLRRDLDRLLR